MNTHRKYGALSSSEDPQKLADTVKGILLGGSVLVIYIASKFGILLTDADITAFATQIGTFISVAWTLYGLFKKATVKIAGKV